jgi:hypothetical protein
MKLWICNFEIDQLIVDFLHQLRQPTLTLVGLLIATGGLGIQCQLASSQENFQNSALNIQPFSCPTDLKTLTDLLLQDLPSYTNRVIQRARRRDAASAAKGDRSADLYSYVLVAGKPEFEPLPLTQRQKFPSLPDTSQQLFFTTLERRYSFGRAIVTQNYHWLFVTQTSSGWRLVMIFTQFGSPSGDRPPSPPQENSEGAVGQAVSLWLRDCRANSIRTR